MNINAGFAHAASALLEQVSVGSTRTSKTHRVSASASGNKEGVEGRGGEGRGGEGVKLVIPASAVTCPTRQCMMSICSRF